LQRLHLRCHFASVPSSDIATRRLVPTAGVIELTYSFCEQSKTGLEQACGAKSFRYVGQDFPAAF
jgi:hypothetical protein